MIQSSSSISIEKNKKKSIIFILFSNKISYLVSAVSLYPQFYLNACCSLVHLCDLIPRKRPQSFSLTVGLLYSVEWSI